MIPIKQGHDSHYVSDLSKAIQMVAKLLYNQVIPATSDFLILM